jgi:hypothetical protein
MKGLQARYSSYKFVNSHNFGVGSKNRTKEDPVPRWQTHQTSSRPREVRLAARCLSAHRSWSRKSWAKCPINLRFWRSEHAHLKANSFCLDPSYCSLLGYFGPPWGRCLKARFIRWNRHKSSCNKHYPKSRMHYCKDWAWSISCHKCGLSLLVLEFGNACQLPSVSCAPICSPECHRTTGRCQCDPTIYLRSSVGAQVMFSRQHSFML